MTVILAPKSFDNDKNIPKDPNKAVGLQESDGESSDDDKAVIRHRTLTPSVTTEAEKLIPKKDGSLEVLYEGHYYDVTDFISRHPGGDVIKLYADSGEDATIAIQQFHYRQWKLIQARMKGLPKRRATLQESVLDPATKQRHDELTKDYHALVAELESEGMFEANAPRFVARIFQCIVIFGIGTLISLLLGATSLIWRAISVLLMTLAGGQCLWLAHEGGHNAFTGYPKVDRMFQIFGYGFVFGLSASSWNYTHSEHHAMPQHETKDSDLKTLPLIAFNKNLVKRKQQSNKLLKYQHILFVLCDTCLVTLTWKWNHHLKFAWKNSCYLDLICMLGHYSLVPLLGFVDWMLITWLGSIYVLGNLVMSHTHFPVVEEGRKLHWVEYAFHYTTNVRSSWWVDWWTGHLNYQIEHHLFPTMPEYKNKLCRERTKAFAKKHQLPYYLCSYWEAVKSTYHNLENVAQEIRHL